MELISRQAILPPPLPTHVALYAQVIALGFRAALGAKKAVERVVRALQPPPPVVAGRPTIVSMIEPLEASLPQVKPAKSTRPPAVTVKPGADHTPTVRLGHRAPAA